MAEKDNKNSNSKVSSSQSTNFKNKKILSDQEIANQLNSIWNNLSTSEKNQLKVEDAKRKSPSSEIIRYINTDGNLVGVGNIIGLSGTDPIGQLVVEGAVLGKPTSWIFNKIFNTTKGIKVLGIGSGNNSLDINPKVDLSDAFDNHMKRLKSGGFERIVRNDNPWIENLSEITEYHNDNAIKFMREQLKYSPQEALKALKELGGSGSIDAGRGNILYHEGLVNRINNPGRYSHIRNIIRSHELDHAVHKPTEPLKGIENIIPQEVSAIGS